MAKLHVITALIEKYSRLSGRLVMCVEEAARLRADLCHLAAVIRMFRAEYDIEAILPKRIYRKNVHFQHGRLTRTALGILRAAKEPMTVREIIEMALKQQGIEEMPPEETLHGMRGSLNGSLGRWKKEGILVAKMDAGVRRWKVAG